MGSFSWVRAEATTKRANLSEGDRYKILVPCEFGGGFITDRYDDYGNIFNWNDSCYIDGTGKVYSCEEFPRNDLYGLLAYWNGCSGLDYDGDEKPFETYDILARGKTTLQENRCKGIEIGCYDDQVDKLKFPLKLVSAGYIGSYESCPGRSYDDPNQGFYRAYWTEPEYEEYRKKVSEE